MQPTYLSSSNINAAGYQLGKMYLRFNSGQVYEYDHVPYPTYDALVKSESSGKFFHRFIRSKYTYKRLYFDPFARRTA